MAFFRAKLLRPGGTSSDAALAVGVGCREPPQIFSYVENLGIPPLPQTAHLPYTSILDAVAKLHEKRPALPEKLNGASQKGKRLRFKHFNTSEL